MAEPVFLEPVRRSSYQPIFIAENEMFNIGSEINSVNVEAIEGLEKTLFATDVTGFGAHRKLLELSIAYGKFVGAEAVSFVHPDNIYFDEKGGLNKKIENKIIKVFATVYPLIRKDLF